MEHARRVVGILSVLTLPLGSCAGHDGTATEGATEPEDLGSAASAVHRAPACRSGAKPNTTALTRTRDDIGIRKLVTPPTKVVRLAQDRSGDVFYLGLSGDINQITIRPGAATTTALVHTGASILAASGIDCKVSPTDTVENSFQGFAFGKHDEIYLVDNCINRTAKTNRGVVVRGRSHRHGTRWSIVAITDPYPDSNTPFDHHYNGVAVSPDGDWLFVNSGSRTDHGEVQDNGGTFPGTREVPLTSAIFRIPADGDGIVLANDAKKLAKYLFADGTRNSFDPTFGPDGDLFAGENGPDADYSEELNVLKKGRHYGFPWRLGDRDNAQQFPTYDPLTDKLLQHPPDASFFAIENGHYHNDPTFPPSPGGFTPPIPNAGPDYDQIRRLDGSIVDASELGQRANSFTPHLSPLGLSFDLDGDLCGEFHRSAFVVMFGAASGVLGVEPSVAHLELDRAGGGFVASTTKLVGGFMKPIDSLLVGNKLVVADFGDWEPSPPGDIYELSLPDARR